MRIACLHTVESNAGVFEAAAAAEGLEVSHTIRTDLLKSAEAAGGSTPAIERLTADALLTLAPEADAILLTCSTVGRGAEIADAEATVPVVRVDAALARQVVEQGGRALVLCAAATTMEPTRVLFDRMADGRAVSLTYRLVPGAWERQKAGDAEGYARIIAAAVDEGFAEGFDTVALAQASMAGAAAFTTRGRPLTSPEAGLGEAIRAASRAVR